MTTTTDTILSTNQLTRHFMMGDSKIDILRGVDLSIGNGEFLAIEGRSGSGKSTLLHILGALDQPSTGNVNFEGKDLFAMSPSVRSGVRNMHFGFVFQFYHLLPELNVLENTQLAAMVKCSVMGFRKQKNELRERAEGLLKSFGMSHRLTHRPSQLSGGERQRVAIARALMNRPKILFADEPTGNLDTETGVQIMKVLEDLHEQGQTIVMVTHDRSIAHRADRTLVLREGRLDRAE